MIRNSATLDSRGGKLEGLGCNGVRESETGRVEGDSSGSNELNGDIAGGGVVSGDGVHGGDDSGGHWCQLSERGLESF